MAELPENLQIVKTERLTPERSPNSTLIKERLNLHVKRRLQQEHQQEQQQLTVLAVNTAPNQQRAANALREDVIAAPTAKRKEKQQHGQKEPAKTRRPYQKRTDKNTTKTQSQTTAENGGRKNKRHRAKHSSLAIGMAVQEGTYDGNADSASMSGGAASLCSVALGTGVGSAEDGNGSGDGNEVELREMSARDKEKCPDILGMVLSVKKRALMQDAEVQAFLTQVMQAFKN